MIPFERVKIGTGLKFIKSLGFNNEFQATHILVSEGDGKVKQIEFPFPVNYRK